MAAQDGQKDSNAFRHHPRKRPKRKDGGNSGKIDKSLNIESTIDNGVMMVSIYIPPVELIQTLTTLTIGVILGALLGYLTNMQKKLEEIRRMQDELKMYNKNLSADYRESITSLKNEMESLRYDLNQLKHRSSSID
jgi:uncharacterized membrane protein (DUF106 family)